MKKYLNILDKINSKKKFYDLKIFDIHFGDILYDQYLKKFRVPTVDIRSYHFKKFLISSMENIIFWENFLSKNKVKSLIVTHATYWNGIPTRITIKKKFLYILLT